MTRANAKDKISKKKVAKYYFFYLQQIGYKVLILVLVIKSTELHTSVHVSVLVL
jgi:hypothetical protein